MVNPENPTGVEQDAMLVEKFVRGDERAFDLLFHRHKNGVYSLVRRTVGSSEADDLVQEVFVQIYKSLPSFRGDSAFRTWALGIAMNVCRMWIRRNHNKNAMISIPFMEDIADASTGVDSGLVEKIQLQRAILSLTEDERYAVEMHYAQGMSYNEIAQAMECPSGTVKARVHSAITRLRRVLLPSMEEVVDI